LFGQESNDINSTIENIIEIASSEKFDSDKFENHLSKFYDWVFEMILDLKIVECSNKVQILQTVLRNIINENNKYSIRFALDDLSEINDNLLDFQYEKGEQDSLEVISDIQPSDKLLKIEDILNQKGTIYSGSEKRFAGYTPSEIIIKQGVNRINIKYPWCHYELILILTNSKLLVIDVKFSLDNRCHITDSTNNFIKNWKKKLTGKIFDYETELLPFIKLPGAVHVESFSRPQKKLKSINFHSEKNKYYRIQISSDPDSVDIMIDEKYWGITPITLVIKKYVLENNNGVIEIVGSKKGFISEAIKYEFKKRNAHINIKLRNKNLLSHVKK